MTAEEVERAALALADDEFLDLVERLDALAQVVRWRRIERLRRGLPPGPLLHPDKRDTEWDRWVAELTRRAEEAA